jgi:hypothetical protein
LVKQGITDSRTLNNFIIFNVVRLNYRYFNTPSVHNTYDIKNVYTMTIGFGPSTTGRHQVFIYRFRSSEGQDPVLFQSTLKITIYFTTQIFTYYWADRWEVGG